MIHQRLWESKPTPFTSLDVSSTAWHASMDTADCCSFGVFDLRIWVTSYNQLIQRASNREESNGKINHSDIIQL